MHGQHFIKRHEPSNGGLSQRRQLSERLCQLLREPLVMVRHWHTLSVGKHGERIMPSNEIVENGDQQRRCGAVLPVSGVGGNEKGAHSENTPPTTAPMISFHLKVKA